MLDQLIKTIRSKADPEKAVHLQRFFKTGPGQYAAGDRFHGLTVPVSRKIASEFASLPLSDLQQLIQSPFHEERLIALHILTLQFEAAGRRHDETIRQQLVDFYLNHTEFINNWDLVDLSAYKILGKYLLDAKPKIIQGVPYSNPRKILYTLVKSKNLWERRIAIITTYTFIKNDDFDDTLKLSEKLLTDQHDLMHKAVGWMLRELGKRSLKTLDKFLLEHYQKMPRTALRYAIERHPENVRQQYLRNLA